MAKESPTEAKSPQPSSTKRTTASEFSDCKQSSSKPMDKASIVKPQREIDTPISASDLITVEKASIASIHEKRISEFESTPPHAPVDATTGASTTQIEPKTKPERDLEPEGKMQEPPIVVAFESELSLENSIIFDTLLVNQEMGQRIPFDVTSYPIWNNLREVEDQLYWVMKAVDFSGCG